MNNILKGNAVVGQSGGPTSAINATLSGVIKASAESENINTLYGMVNGINGMIAGNLIKIDDMSEEELFLLECTPSAALGSCRKKLPDVNSENEGFYKSLFAKFAEYDIRYFFYIGGNDSMDTVDKLSKYAEYSHYDIKFMGIPKTIDNDLACTDHTPGFGSAAKFVATTLQEIACDCAVYNTKAVTIVEVMGRDAGWLTAAAGLSRLVGERTADLIYLPEVYFDYDDFVEDVKALLDKKPNIVVALSEGIKTKDGKYVGEAQQSGAVDIFGHKYLAGAARVLEGIIKEKIGCKVRAVELSLPQRCAAHCLSKCDIDESVLIGKSAVEIAEKAEKNTGNMVVFEREDGEDYKISIDFIDVNCVANKIKKVDRSYINQRGNNVTDELLKLLLPLIDGDFCVPTKNGLPIHFRFDLKK